MRRGWLIIVIGCVLAAIGGACSSFDSDESQVTNEGGTEATTSGGGDAGRDVAITDARDDACIGLELTKDPHNCGACGHDCLGGMCTAGQCAPLLLANTAARVLSMAASDAGVFWIVEGGTSVYGCPPGGCNEDGGAPLAGALIDTRQLTRFGPDFAVRTVNGDGTERVYRFKSTGSLQEVGSFDKVSAIAGDTVNQLYVVGQLRGTNEAYRITADSDAGPVPYIANGNAVDVAVGGTRLFLYAGNGENRFYACDAPGPCLSTATDILDSAAMFNGIDEQLAATKNALYWLRPSLGTVFSLPATGGTPSMLFGMAAAKLTSIAADDDFVYFTQDNLVRRCPPAGCGTIPPVATGTAPHAVAVSKDAIYWATNEADGGAPPAAIYRLAK